MKENYVRLYSETESKYFDYSGNELTAQELFPDNNIYAKKIDYVEDRLYNYNRQNINSSTYSTLSEKAQLGMQTLVSKVQDFFDALQILDLEYSSAIKNLEIRIYSILLLKGNLDESVWQKCFTFHLHDIWCHPSLPFYYKMSLSCAILRFKTLVRMIRYFYRAAIK